MKKAILIITAVFVMIVVCACNATNGTVPVTDTDSKNNIASLPDSNTSSAKAEETRSDQSNTDEASEKAENSQSQDVTLQPEVSDEHEASTVIEVSTETEISTVPEVSAIPAEDVLICGTDIELEKSITFIDEEQLKEISVEYNGQTLIGNYYKSCNFGLTGKIFHEYISAEKISFEVNEENELVSVFLPNSAMTSKTDPITEKEIKSISEAAANKLFHFNTDEYIFSYKIIDSGSYKTYNTYFIKQIGGINTDDYITVSMDLCGNIRSVSCSSNFEGVDVKKVPEFDISSIEKGILNKAELACKEKLNNFDGANFKIKDACIILINEKYAYDCMVEVTYYNIIGEYREETNELTEVIVFLEK